MKKPISGQYKVNLDTGEFYVVGSKATERPSLEKQASLLQWGEDKVKLERWQSEDSRNQSQNSAFSYGSDVGISFK
jgi:hypothetical protein